MESGLNNWSHCTGLFHVQKKRSIFTAKVENWAINDVVELHWQTNWLRTPTTASARFKFPFKIMVHLLAGMFFNLRGGVIFQFAKKEKRRIIEKW